MIEKFELRKLQKTTTGDSYTIIIPKKYMLKMGIDRGDFIKIMLDREGKRIIMEKGF